MLVFVLGMIVPAREAKAEDVISMMRLYNPATHEHLHTADAYEKYVLTTQQNWNDEGYSWNAPVKSDTPVYRLFNQWSGEHFYTRDANERGVLISNGWNDEGVGWYSDDAAGAPVYRVFNADAGIGSHHYTTDYNEYQTLTTQMGWTDEGIAWYGVNTGGTPVPGPDPTPEPGPDQEETKKQLEIISFEYSSNIVDDQIAYTVRIKNPNSGYVITYPGIEMTVRNAAGNVIKTASSHIAYINPGEVVTYSDCVYCPDTETFATMEIVPTKTYEWYYHVPSAEYIYQNDLEIVNMYKKRNNYYTTYTGELKNNSTVDLDRADISLVFRKNGEICYVSKTYVNDIKSGAKKAFEFSVYEDDFMFDSYSFEANL